MERMRRPAMESPNLASLHREPDRENVYEERETKTIAQQDWRVGSAV